MINITLYYRINCHLCDQIIEDLSKLQNEFPHELTIIDIDEFPKLKQEFNNEIPVVKIGSIVLKAPITIDELRKGFFAVQQDDGNNSVNYGAKQQGLRVNDPKWTSIDRFTLFLTKHYLAILNSLVLLFVGLPFLAPLFLKIGAESPARVIYTFYGTTCHQLAYRSLFLFGEQPYYPREASGIENLLSFSEATGMSEGSNSADLWAARQFTGNGQVGYKVALCERDVALYFGILLFGLLFGLTRRKIPPLPWYLWIVIGLIPIGLDGVSQLISQPPLSLIPFRESTPLLRVATGFLFGFSTAWFGIPLVEQSMHESLEIIEAKHENYKSNIK